MAENSSKDLAHRAYTSRLKKFRANKSKSVSNQGSRVDKEIRALQCQYTNINTEDVHSFSDLPLSYNTQEGLKGAEFTTPTDIQKQSIGVALQGHDILGAAKTGSGKTLAFLIPVLELLYRTKVGFIDGMSALIVSPTRELAYQTYSVLKKIGVKHDFSAGLVIGGKDLKEERDRISRTHIVICTPGRLQQHMEQTWGFSADGLQILVLDECDRILDMGFEETMNAILEYIPEERQTLMFSATQTKSVKDLARVGLKSPHYISVHEKAEHSTPVSLEQSYLVCDSHSKLNTLWFFIKNHLKSKILVFIQSAKQVRYIHESFQLIRSGTTLLSLHGTMKQQKRVKTYEEFCRKQNVVLFATDLAARGLDFPGVNWVVQLDAPADADTYIHRVGRTARYESDGEALIFLLSSERQEMLRLLEARKIPIEEIKVNPKKIGDISKQLATQLAGNPELKEFAKASFLAYMKGYFLMSNKAMFDITKIDTDKYSKSLGLDNTPRIRYLQKREKLQKEKEQRAQEVARQLAKKSALIANTDTESEDESSEEDDSDRESDQSDAEESESDQSGGEESESDHSGGEESESDQSGSDESESDQLKHRKFKLLGLENEDDDSDDMLAIKSPLPDELDDIPEPEKLSLQQELERKSKAKQRAISKRDMAAAMKKRGLTAKRTVFEGSDEENSGSEVEMEDTEYIHDMEAARDRVNEQDGVDKETHRERVKRKHQERRWKAKKAKLQQDESSEDEIEAVLGPPSGDNITASDDSDVDKSDDELPETNQSDDAQSENNESESEDESVATSVESDDNSTGASGINTHVLDDDEAFALQLLQKSR